MKEEFVKTALWYAHDTCCDKETRKLLLAILARDGKKFDELMDASYKISRPTEVGDKIQGVGYCNHAPGGVVYHVDEKGFAHCATLSGVDGGLAKEGHKVFGKMEFVPGMLKAHRRQIVEEIAKWIEGGGCGWIGNDFKHQAAEALRREMTIKENE